MVSYCKQQQTKKNVYWAFCAELYSTDRNAFAPPKAKRMKSGLVGESEGKSIGKREISGNGK